MSKIITLGTFDMLHAGHLRLFKKCADLGEVIVGLNTDGFVKKFKGKMPIMSYVERKEMIEETNLVERIVPNGQKDGTAKKAILSSDANLIVVGSDWARRDYVGQIGVDWDWLDKNGIGICYINYTWNISTSELKKRLYEN